MSIWKRLLVQYPRFADTLTAGQPITLEELATREVILEAVAKGQEIFGIEQPKHAAQLWFHSLCTAIVGPAVTAMVEFDVIPSLDIRRGQLHNIDGYWFGFRPEEMLVDASLHLSGTQFGDSIRVVIDALCAATDLRPAPLWAVASDALGIAASGAGVEAFEEEHAREVAEALIEGMNSVNSVPSPRFNDDDYFIRAGCCMIFHSPRADFCTSCPQKR